MKFKMLLATIANTASLIQLSAVIILFTSSIHTAKLKESASFNDVLIELNEQSSLINNLTIQIENQEKELKKAQKKVAQLEKSFDIGSLINEKLTTIVLETINNNLTEHRNELNWSLNGIRDLKQDFANFEMKIQAQMLTEIKKNFQESNTNHTHTVRVKLEYRCRDASTSSNVWDLPGVRHAPPNGHIIYLDKHHVKCNSNEYLSQFQLVRQGDHHAKYAYQCCFYAIIDS